LRLYLPRAEGGATIEAPALPMTQKPVSGTGTVLVVEDDESLRHVALHLLESLAYRTIQAADAKAALDILRGPTPVDLLFTDIVMPGGMNGAVLAVEARRLRPTLRVVLASGYSESFGLQGGALPAALLGKPYNRHRVAAALAKALA
jgi:CheY-like chemotaxis protein